jgi:cytochrome c peroxidase
MNDKDMNNIYFILNRTPEQLEAWWNSMDEEDKEYAMWIIKEYKKELTRMETIYDDFLTEDDTSLAKDYLKKFQL